MNSMSQFTRLGIISSFLSFCVVGATGCRPGDIRAYMSDAHDLPCLAEDTAESLDYDRTGPLGFAPREVEAALGGSFAPEGLRRRGPNRGAYEGFDPDVGFLPTARLIDIRFDEDAWELVDRPDRQGMNGLRGTRSQMGTFSRFHAPNGGPRPDYTCMTGKVMRGWGSATAVFDHEEYGELTWDVEGWVEAQSTEPDELVFLFADWRRRSWLLPRGWRKALKKESGDWCPVQAQAVVEGQQGWGGWFTVHVVRERCPMGKQVAASPLVDFRWLDIGYNTDGSGGRE